MEEYITTYVGLDVRKDTTAIAVAGLARILQCAVERRVFLVGANPAQQLSFSVGSSRSGTSR